MALRIIWTKRANTKFNQIISFLEHEWGDKVTTNFVRKAYTIIELLSEQPLLGTLEKPGENIRGFLITKHHRLFYRFTSKEFVLLNFFDTRSGRR